MCHDLILDSNPVSSELCSKLLISQKASFDSGVMVGIW